MEKKYVVGIDFGTTGSKTLIVDLEGNEVGVGSLENPISYPEPNSFEITPEDFENTLFSTTKLALEKSGIDPNEILGVSLTSIRSHFGLYDKEGRDVCSMILWPDNRTDIMDAEIRETIQKAGYTLDEFYDATGFPHVGIMPLFRLLYTRKRWPETFARIEKICTLQGAMIKLYGDSPLVDGVEDRVWFQLFEPTTGRPLEKLIKAFGLENLVTKFADWVPAGTQCGGIGRHAAQKTGLIEGTPLFVGSGDGQCAALGVGCIQPGFASIAFGSLGVIASRHPEWVPDPLRICNISGGPGGCWETEITSSSAGASFRWFRDTLCAEENLLAASDGRDPYDIMTERAAKSPIGSNGLLFMPYLTGANAPQANPIARGAYLGIGMTTNKEDFIRSTMEGVTYTVKEALDCVQNALGIDFSVCRVSGGATHSKMWNQMMADIFGCAVETVAASDATALGAAMIAAVGAGAYADLQEAADHMVRVTSRYDPIPENVALYRKYFKYFQCAYTSLANGGFYSMGFDLEQNK